MGAENVSLTPPEIVARSEDRAQALIAFVAQELEHWGFEALNMAPVGNGLAVRMPDDEVLMLTAIDCAVGLEQ